MSAWSSLLPPTDVEAKRPGQWPALWQLALDFVEGGTILKITAEDGKWKYSADGECGPNGDPASLIMRSKCLCAAAPVGALIGKIGGSAAAAADGTVFAAGALCVIKVPADGGPLYFSINDEENGMDNNGGSLKVTVERRLT
ncbi:MAG TPA: hypothetical protein VHS78_20605 [Candidatus Elarobacter sp.]|jgi:hypothetical protein|nr:hypothetical protein [Candidatus Elarobacter sp.]